MTNTKTPKAKKGSAKQGPLPKEKLPLQTGGPTGPLDLVAQGKGAVAPPPPDEPLVAKASLPVPEDATEKAKEEAIARFAFKSSVNSAIVVEQYSKSIIPAISLGSLQGELSKSLRKVTDGDMAQAETMLMGQAIALQSIFTHFAQRARGQEFVRNTQNFLNMAMKAQNQCRMTLETLNELKNPRQVSFVRADQANVSHGHQQVNNQLPSRENIENRPNELLEQTYGERLDGGAASAAKPDDPQLEALGTINGTPDRGGKGQVGTKRLQRRRHTAVASGAKARHPTVQGAKR
jgi:hypothetical protein